MIDTIKLQLPIKSDFITYFTNSDGDYSGADVCPKLLHSMGFKMAAGEVEIGEDEKPQIHRLHCPFQSLPSHNSSLAFKLYVGGQNYFPFIELNASGAKLLQGHNVFGSNDVEENSMALLECFFFNFPEVRKIVDVPLIEVSQIDLTFFAKVPNYHISKQVVSALKNVSTGQIKKSSSYETTAMWNAGSKNIVRIAYLKSVEVTRQIEEIEKKLKRSPSDYLRRQLKALTSETVQKMAENNIRFEAKIKKLALKKRGISNLLADLIHTDKQDPTFIQKLWLDCWSPIFKSFEGNNVNIYDDSKVQEALKAKFYTQTKSGISYAKANRIFRFFRSLKTEGYDNVQDTSSRTTFWRSLNELTQVVSLSDIQNLTAGNNQNIIPLVRLINVDFANQLPENYIAPKSMFKQLLKSA
jgi:II/X family phage/plasmid replication protein